MELISQSLAFLTLLISITRAANYIINGGFEDLVLPPIGYLGEGAVGWNGS